MPMSWKQGSQLTITSVSVSKWAPTNIASALATMLACEMHTALGKPVDPDVNCISARSSSCGVHGVDRVTGQQFLDGQHADSALGQHRRGGHERVGDDDDLRLDHADDVHGLLRPTLQVGARGGLMQHGQAGAAHPDALGGGGDLDRGACQHGHGVAVSDAGGGEAARDATGPFVHLFPGVPNRCVRDRRSSCHCDCVCALANIVSVNLLTKIPLALARWRRCILRSSCSRPSVEHLQEVARGLGAIAA